MTGGIPQSKPTQSTKKSKKNLNIDGQAAQEREKKRNVPLKHRKEIITVLQVMTLFLLEERNKEAMTVFRGSLAPTHEGEVNTREKAEE